MNASAKKQVPFSNLIGQEALKTRLNYSLLQYGASLVSPNYCFVGSSGYGKTEFAKAYARQLHMYMPPEHPAPEGCILGENGLVLDEYTKKPKHKPFRIINSATIKNPGRFFEDIFIKHINGQHVTILFDEIHSLPERALDFFLQFLPSNPFETPTITVHFEGAPLVFEYKRMHTFLFATTELQDLPETLKRRTTLVSLAPYNNRELLTIVRRSSKGVEYKEGVLAEMSKYLRGSPWHANRIGSDVFQTPGVVEQLKGSKTAEFTKEEWAKLVTVLNLLPLGIDSIELKAIKIISAYPDGIALKSLAAKMELTVSATQWGIEFFLLTKGLMEIGAQSLRKLSYKGYKYLDDIGYDYVETFVAQGDK